MRVSQLCNYQMISITALVAGNQHRFPCAEGGVILLTAHTHYLTLLTDLSVAKLSTGKYTRDPGKLRNLVEGVVNREPML
jgi:hypothetical protein